MLNILRRKPKQIHPSLLELSGDGHCAVVGELHYQQALSATNANCSIAFGSARAVPATLLPEPSNPYDPNAVAVHSPDGKLGHLSRNDAEAYRELFADVAGRGYHGGTCNAHLVGGEPAKPYFGVVLELADPEICLAEVLG
jgi:hypothetical protein